MTFRQIFCGVFGQVNVVCKNHSINILVFPGNPAGGILDVPGILARGRNHLVERRILVHLQYGFLEFSVPSDNRRFFCGVVVKYDKA